MSENDSMHVQYSVFTLQQANHNKIEKKERRHFLSLCLCSSLQGAGVVVRVVVCMCG